jgi:hypothetical protein
MTAKKLNGHPSSGEEDEDSLYSPDASSNSDSPEAPANKETEQVEEPDDEEEVEEEKEKEPDEPAAVVEQTEAEKEQEKKENELKLARIRNNVDYGTILAFMDMFSPYLSIKPLPFNTFETSLLETRTCMSNRTDLNVF